MGLAARVGPEESGGPQTVSLGDMLAPEDKVAVARAVVWGSGFPALVLWSTPANQADHTPLQETHGARELI